MFLKKLKQIKEDELVSRDVKKEVERIMEFLEYAREYVRILEVYKNLRPIQEVLVPQKYKNSNSYFLIEDLYMEEDISKLEIESVTYRNDTKFIFLCMYEIISNKLGNVSIKELFDSGNYTKLLNQISSHQSKDFSELHAEAFTDCLDYYNFYDEYLGSSTSYRYFLSKQEKKGEHYKQCVHSLKRFKEIRDSNRDCFSLSMDEFVKKHLDTIHWKGVEGIIEEAYIYYKENDDRLLGTLISARIQTSKITASLFSDADVKSATLGREENKVLSKATSRYSYEQLVNKVDSIKMEIGEVAEKIFANEILMNIIENTPA